MKKALRYLLLFAIVLVFDINANAQVNVVNTKDSVIELYGVVMTADSLQAIPAASVIVSGKGRGTITNDQGVFSIVVLKGDKVKFSCVGFKDHLVVIPQNLKGNQYSVIQLMVTDTAYLPATIIRPRPTHAQFERDFVNTEVPADEYEVARQNISAEKRRILLATLPADGQEAVSTKMRQDAQKYYYQGQQPPINLFNPAAWAEFIQAWKRGDFKSNNSNSDSGDSGD